MLLCASVVHSTEQFWSYSPFTFSQDRLDVHYNFEILLILNFLYDSIQYFNTNMIFLALHWQRTGCDRNHEDISWKKHTHTHLFNGPLSRTTQVGRYQKGKTNLDFTEARDSEWQWHQLGSIQVCTSLQTDNHASTPPLSFLQAACPFCRPTNSFKALKVNWKKLQAKFSQ